MISTSVPLQLAFIPSLCLFVCILTVFCEACQDKPGLYATVSEMLPIKVASYMLLPYTLPVQSAYSVAQR